MSDEELKRLNTIAKKTLEESRSRDDIRNTFHPAGIIDKSGKLTHPYKSIFDPIRYAF